MLPLTVKFINLARRNLILLSRQTVCSIVTPVGSSPTSELCSYGGQLVRSCSSSPVGGDAAATSSSEVQLSAACVKRLRQLTAAEAGSCSGQQQLRLAVDGGGCSGFQYTFTLVEQAEPDDVRVQRDDVHVLVDPTSLEYVRGSTIDFTEELIRSAFRVIDNPQSEQGCSCGVSFSIKID